MPRITERLVRTARPRSRKYEISCTALSGFILRVLPSGKRVYYVRLRKDGHDDRVRLGSVESMNLAEAQARASELLFENSTVGQTAKPISRPPLLRGEKPSTRSATITVRRFVDRYLTDHVDRYLKPNTRAKYRDHLKHVLTAFGDQQLRDITRERVEAWHASMRDRPSAANNALRVLSNLFTKAYDWGVLDERFLRPTRRVRKHKENRRERFLTPTERKRLDAVLRHGRTVPFKRKGYIHWATEGAVRLLALTGMRMAEVLDLTWPMVDLRHRCFRLPDSKTGQKNVPIGSPVITLLKELAKHKTPGCDYVIHSSTRGRLHKESLSRSWREIRKRAGLDDVRLHDLRHSAASDALMSGVPLAVVGKILGHKQPATTARYAHIADDVLADAVEQMSVSIASHASHGGHRKRRRRCDGD